MKMRHAKTLGIVMAMALAAAVLSAGDAAAVQICRGLVEVGDGKCTTANAEREVLAGEKFTATRT
jgi:hypothetical protein